MSEAKETKKRGRPLRFVEARGSLTIRLRNEVRQDVERAAVLYGKSLSEEIETRLEVSFALTNYLRHEWGDDVFRIAGALASSLSFIENWTGKSWTDDVDTFNLIQQTAANLIRNYRDLATKAAGRATPHGDLEGKSVEELGQIFAALGGLPPPRPKKLAAAETSSEQRSDRTRSRASMNEIVSKKVGDEEAGE